MRNLKVVLARRPAGVPVSSDFRLEEDDVGSPGLGEVLVQNQFASVDPGMRGWINEARNYREPVPLGAVMPAHAVGKVLESGDERYKPGDVVFGLFGWQTYGVVRSQDVIRVISDHELPYSTALGVLGINGITAYLALTGIGRPQSAETVLVSSAAGSVGSIVGQIARIRGCRTIGITGGAQKVSMCLDSFGYDAAIDYKAAGDLHDRIAQSAPGGVDIYFDNTSGAIQDAAMSNLNIGARVVVCGTAAISEWDPVPLGPRVERVLLTRRATMTGFLVTDHEPQFEDAIAQLSAWVRSGQIQYREHLLDGLARAPDALPMLFAGANTGKLLIRI
jgi:NADPH-dependent curcumin reductase